LQGDIIGCETGLFDQTAGAKKAILHIYLATSPCFRRIIFNMDRKQSLEMAVKSLVIERAYFVHLTAISRLCLRSMLKMMRRKQGLVTPDDVALQVLAPCREDLIRRTVDSLKGAKKAILHIYLATVPAWAGSSLVIERAYFVHLTAISRLCLRSMLKMIP
jgi:isopropylmalate/homocitrate/citramalate synthase